MEVLKISSKSNPNSVAGAIAGLVKESIQARMQAIGAGALNQAVKAVAIARGFVAPSGVDLVCIPAFAEVHTMSASLLVSALLFTYNTTSQSGCSAFAFFNSSSETMSAI